LQGFVPSLCANASMFSNIREFTWFFSVEKMLYAAVNNIKLPIAAIVMIFFFILFIFKDSLKCVLLSVSFQQKKRAALVFLKFLLFWQPPFFKGVWDTGSG